MIPNNQIDIWFNENITKEVSKLTNGQVVPVLKPMESRIVGKEVWGYGSFQTKNDQHGLIVSDPQMIKALYYMDKNDVSVYLRHGDWRFVFPLQKVT